MEISDFRLSFGAWMENWNFLSVHARHCRSFFRLFCWLNEIEKQKANDRVNKTKNLKLETWQSKSTKWESKRDENQLDLWYFTVNALLAFVRCCWDLPSFQLFTYELKSRFSRWNVFKLFNQQRDALVSISTRQDCDDSCGGNVKKRERIRRSKTRRIFNNATWFKVGFKEIVELMRTFRFVPFLFTRPSHSWFCPYLYLKLQSNRAAQNFEYSRLVANHRVAHSINWHSLNLRSIKSDDSRNSEFARVIHLELSG